MVTKNSSPLHSSPLASGASPRLQNLLQNKRPSTGSYGCIREVLHPLDPRAEPTALLYYDSSSDDGDDLENDELVRIRGLSDKPIKRRLSFGTDMQPKKVASSAEGARYSSVYSPNAARVPRRQQEFSPYKPPSTRKAVELGNVSEEDFLGRFSSRVGLTPSKSPLRTPQRGMRGSPESSRRSKSLLTPDPFQYLSGIRAPENTPAGNPAINMDGLNLESLGEDIKRYLNQVRAKTADMTMQEITSRLEAYIEALKQFSEAESHDEQIQFALEELAKIGVIRTETAQQLLLKCQKRKTRMSQTAIIARWLVHDIVYDEDALSTANNSSNSLSRHTPLNLRSLGASPSSPFAFRSPNQLDFSPLQSRSLYISPTRHSRRKSDMAETIANLQEKLQRLQCTTESLGEAKKASASREHEISMKRYYEQLAEVSNKAKVEMALDIHLQRLLEERRAQERAIIEARLRAEAEAKRREEEALRWAAQELARKQAEQEARKRAEEEEARRRAAEQAVKEEEARKAWEQQEAKRRESEAQAKAKADAEKAKAAEEKKEAAETGPPTAPAALEEYGRKNLQVENAEMRRLLALLKDVRKTVNANKELFKKVNLKKRSLNPKLGQLNGELAQTNFVRNFVIKILSDFKEDTTSSPMIDASLYQLNRDPRIENKPPHQVPLAYIWMVNEFGKMVAKQVESESSVSIKTANPIGIVVCSALARDVLLANNRSFIDIIIARLWKKSPILQGVLGPEDTERKMEQLGWTREEDTGKWEEEEKHVNRMVGYAAGFAAIAGRNFSNSNLLTNPYPPFNLWFLLAYWANNSDKLTNTHFFCIKTFLEVAGDTLRKVYGREGDKLVRVVLGQLAEVGAQRGFAGAIGLQALGAKFQKDGKFA